MLQFPSEEAARAAGLRLDNPAAVRRCPRCGTANPPSADVCRDCGWLLTAPAPTPGGTPPAGSAAAPPAAPVTGTAPPRLEPRWRAGQRRNPTGRPPVGPWAAAGAAALALPVVWFAGYLHAFGAIHQALSQMDPGLFTQNLGPGITASPRGTTTTRQASGSRTAVPAREHLALATQQNGSRTTWVASGAYSPTEPIELPVVLINPQTGARRAVVAEVDSGAFHSMVSPAVAAQLGLATVGHTMVSGVTGAATVPEYSAVRIASNAGQTLWSLPEPLGAEGGLPAGTQMLLGRDLLDQSGTRLVVTGNTWHLTVTVSGGTPPSTPNAAPPTSPRSTSAPAPSPTPSTPSPTPTPPVPQTTPSPTPAPSPQASPTPAPQPAPGPIVLSGMGPQTINVCQLSWLGSLTCTPAPAGSIPTTTGDSGGAYYRAWQQLGFPQTVWIGPTADAAALVRYVQQTADCEVVSVPGAGLFPTAPYDAETVVYCEAP